MLFFCYLKPERPTSVSYHEINNCDNQYEVVYSTLITHLRDGKINITLKHKTSK